MFASIRSFAFLAALLCGTAMAAPPQDFALQSVTTREKFQLSASRGKYVALHFLLKTECPYCLKHTRDYLHKSGRLPGVQQVFIKPDSDDEIRKWAASIPTSSTLAGPIYRDPEAALAKQFEIPDGYKFHGQTVHYPALVLLDPAGKEVFRYVGKSNADRYSFEQLEGKITELKAAGER